MTTETKFGETGGLADDRDEKRKKLSARESKEELLDSAEAFTKELLAKYPQVTPDGKLNYYLSGSLAVMLLLKGGAFEILNGNQIPAIVPTGGKEISAQGAKILGGFVRQIGDIDFVGTTIYDARQAEVQKAYKDIPAEEYRRRRKELLWKGGGGPQMSELSASARKIFKADDTQLSVMCDPLKRMESDGVARISLAGNEVYIVEPKLMLSYKTVHLGQHFEKADKTQKFIKDFNVMNAALETLYTRGELLESAHKMMLAYGADSPNSTFVPYHNPEFKEEMRTFFDDALQLDTNAEYIQNLQYGKERSIGVLKILHRLDSKESKQAVIEFINAHRAGIDLWAVNTSSPHNRDVIAGFLFSQPELLADFASKSGTDPSTRESITEALKTHPWAFEKYGKQMPDESVLEKRPERSGVMDALIALDANDTLKELQTLDDLIRSGTVDYRLRKGLEEKRAQFS